MGEAREKVVQGQAGLRRRRQLQGWTPKLQPFQLNTERVMGAALERPRR